MNAYLVGKSLLLQVEASGSGQRRAPRGRRQGRGPGRESPLHDENGQRTRNEVEEKKELTQLEHQHKSTKTMRRKEERVTGGKEDEAEVKSGIFQLVFAGDSENLLEHHVPEL